MPSTAEYQAQVYRAKRANGICTRCPNKSAGGVYCVDCKLSTAKDIKRTRIRLKKSGKCRECRKEAPPGWTSCLECAERNRIRHSEWLVRMEQLGLCIACGAGKPSIGGKCADCHNRRMEIQENRRTGRVSAGLCAYCGTRPLIGNNNGCVRCVLINAARSNRLGEGGMAMLERKWVEQGGLCYYTGLPIAIGVDASVDHLTPKSRGGANTEDNIVWCHITVNLTKSDRTEQEFISLCGSVARHRGSGYGEIGPLTRAPQRQRKKRGAKIATD